jgi:hypothetical protein
LLRSKEGEHDVIRGFIGLGSMGSRLHERLGYAHRDIAPVHEVLAPYAEELAAPAGEKELRKSG